MSEPVVKLSNRDVAQYFQNIADLLEIKGEVVYKTLAYRKAADSITDLGRDINAVWEDGKLTDIPGVGKAIAEKIDELLSTGEMTFYNNLTAEVPVSLAELVQVPDLGPKKVRLIWQELEITTLEQLKAAAEAGQLQDLPGMGAKSEARILAGIEALSRRTDRIPLGDAWPAAQALLEKLRALPGVVAAEAAGSLRRMKATVGDLDILVAAEDSAPIMEAFTGDPQVARVLGHGEVKSSVEYLNGLRTQLWVHHPNKFGTAIQYATGSKDHNVRLRELSHTQGLSLSEQAFVREDESLILCATEEEVYGTLGLPWIPPELREDRGEIQAAQAGKLPELIEPGDLQTHLHTHTTWSDGKASIKEMAEAAIARGYKILAITDHSVSLGIANGLSVKRLKEQRKEIDSVQEELGDRIRLLQGAEVEIKADATLDYDDEVLAGLDIVIGAIHTGLRQPREQVTERMLNTVNNPYVDIIAHPTGRMIPDREPADLDMDAVLAAAAASGVALEINANPSRLDLRAIYSRRAIELGIPLSINTDAHHPDHYDFAHFGVAIARRGWVGPGDVINTWEPEKLMKWLESRNK